MSWSEPGEFARPGERRGYKLASSLRGIGIFADATGAQNPVQQQVEVRGHLLGAVSWPDVERFCCTLRLLERRTLGQLRTENERAEHVAQFLDPELVLHRLRTHPVDDDAEGLEARAEAATDLLDGAQRAVGGGHGEQAGLGDDDDPVTGRPRRAGEGVERGGAVDEHEVVVVLDVREGLFEFPDVTDRRVRSVEVDGGRAADEHVDRAGVGLGPPARGDRLTDRLLLGRSENVGNVQSTGEGDVHAGGHIGLGIEVDDESANAFGERG